jgi:hypothetical protein
MDFKSDPQLAQALQATGEKLVHDVGIEASCDDGDLGIGRDVGGDELGRLGTHGGKIKRSAGFGNLANWPGPSCAIPIPAYNSRLADSARTEFSDFITQVQFLS